MIKILVVADKLSLNTEICSFLNEHGYDACGCTSIPSDGNAFGFNAFDLIIFGIDQQYETIIQYARNIRAGFGKASFLFISDRRFLPAILGVHMVGKDDYMDIPVDMMELLLRIRALMRRTHGDSLSKIVIGNFEMDAYSRTAFVDGTDIPMTAREFDILYKMLSYPNKVFSRALLMDELWGSDRDSGQRAVDVYITKLRNKLNACNGFQIVTVRGIGYKAILTRRPE